MAASDIDIFVLDFSNPSTTNTPPERSRVTTNQSYEFTTSTVVTLSANTVNPGSDLEGLLYVPTLLASDPCVNASSPYVPSNVTRRSNLPSTEYQYVAFAPWFSAPCARSYLNAAGKDNSALVFYSTAANASSDSPPSPNDPTWSLGDGGQWKSQHPWPVFAIPGSDGPQVMQQLALYSGNMSSAPFGNFLVQQFYPTDYVRLYASFGTDGGNNLPTLWAFLLIILGVVLVIIGLTSLIMHAMQRRKRQALQRRIERGEVDLELLGINCQRLTQADVDALPLSPFSPSEKATVPAPQPNVSPKTDSNAETVESIPPGPQEFDQSTCPICLEDFVANETSVRTLPCRHIFHPDCIDRYLINTSSLCPICKQKSKSVNTTSGQHITVTNAMVRRERYARRIRERRAQLAAGDGQAAPPPSSRLSRLIPSSLRPLQRTEEATATTPNQVEMAIVNPAPVPISPHSPLQPTDVRPSPMHAAFSRRASNRISIFRSSVYREPAPTDPESRREWARRRASALLGPTSERTEPAAGTQTEPPPRPKWRRALASAFPGFR